MVSGQLEESLRNEIESYIEGRLSGVKQEIAALQSRLNESLTQLMDRQSEVQLDGSVAASIMEHLRAAHEQGIELAASESTRAKASSDMAIIKAAVGEIGEHSTQAQILKSLVNRSASFAPRIAFFAVKGDQAIGWRARGFQGSVGDSAIQQVSVPLSSDSVVGDVARSRTTWSGGPHSHSEDHLLLNRLGGEAPQRIVAVPLTVRGRSVAVLYADSGSLDAEAINLEALETLVKVSGMAVELLADHAVAQQAAPAAERVAEAPMSQDSLSGYVPQMEYQEPAGVMPAEVTHEEPAPQQDVMAAEVIEEHAEPIQEISEPLSAEPISAAPLGAEPMAAEPMTAEQMAAQPVAAEREAEEVGTSDHSAASPRRRYGSDVELPVSVASEEERRLHVDARRFARLLVSEIKLYNETKVADGRAKSDLYDRLREYIDRSREMYDKRVKPEVAQKYDYFHHELVNTLAEGDTSKLGNAYPGATVSA
ncbi:MAG: hypothetical protein ABJB97_00915 [Acidobacteriota bacterium]